MAREIPSQPAGLEQWAEFQPIFRRPYCWDSLVIDDEVFIALLISSLTPINALSLFVCGHFHGAFMAYRFAATHPDVVACAGVCAGHLSAGLVLLSSPVALMCA